VLSSRFLHVFSTVDLYNGSAAEYEGYRRKMRMKKLLVVSLLVLYSVGCTSSEPATSTPVPPTPTDAPVPTATPVPATPTVTPRNLTNIEYFDGRRLDLYRPEEGSGPFPTVLVLHDLGDSKGKLTWLGEELAASGYAIVAPNWSPPSLAAENALCALAWIHASAETFGFDPKRIAAFGHSVGGSLAALLAAIDDPTEFLQECPYALPESASLKGTIACAGSFFMPEWYLTTGKDLFEFGIETLQIPPDEAEEIRQTLLDTPPAQWLEVTGFDDKGTRLIHTVAAAWVDGSEPPFLLVHGSEDTVVAPVESEAFADLLERAGVEVQVKIIPSAGHSVGPAFPGYDEFLEATVAFLAKVLE
jgi:acetyl esterase/lipase